MFYTFNFIFHPKYRGSSVSAMFRVRLPEAPRAAGLIIVLLLLVATLPAVYMASEDGKKLDVGWLSECGCTGIEIESVTLASILWNRGFQGLRLNECKADNPRCEGQLPSAATALEGLTSARPGSDSPEQMPDVAVAHVAFMGVCGVPREFSHYTGCRLKAAHAPPGLLARIFGFGSSARRLSSSLPMQRHSVRGSHNRFERDCTRPYMIARAMGEEDSIGSLAANNCNRYYDEVWVPSSFHVKAFTESGVEKDRIHVVPETIDFEAFDPAKVSPHDVPKTFSSDSPVEVTFLSVFKWEPRKNWSQLLLAFAHLFLLEPRVGLFIKTSRYMGAMPKRDANLFLRSLVARIKASPSEFIKTQVEIYGRTEEEVRTDLKQDWVFDKKGSKNILQRLLISDERLPTDEMPNVFKAGDAFVLPSHGEGWGLPLMEAMAMELPTIGTNFGGNVDFMHPSCSLLVDVEKMTVGGGGAQWAVPDTRQLMAHMHWVFANPEAAKELGRRARRHLLENWGTEKAAAAMQARLAAAHQALRAAPAK